MKDFIKFRGMIPRESLFSRREILKAAGVAGLLAALPVSLAQRTLAAREEKSRKTILQSDLILPDWIAEARIGGLTVSGIKISPGKINRSLDQVLIQGVTVIEADSGLSNYLSEEEFNTRLQTIKDATGLIHKRGLKVVWFVPALKLITINGLIRKDSFARKHPDWLQISFDGERQKFRYGKKVSGGASDDEDAWLCPNSPYREWIKEHLRRLAKTGVDGLWLGDPVLGRMPVMWGCSCNYCREKFTLQTGMKFPRRFSVADKRFWRFIQWRHETLTEFLDDCKKAITSGNPTTTTIAEIVAPDHLGATLQGTEGSALANILNIWKVNTVSDVTAMAEASYDDWIAMHNVFKYCRGATMDKPSWVVSFGYDENDSQLTMASAVAAQNNPYELRVPQMASSVGSEFRSMMFYWISKYSKQIFRSKSLSPVAVIYSERNRDFLDTLHTGGIFTYTRPPGIGRKWLPNRNETPLRMEYMGDYRGLSTFLYQHQIPADIYPFSRVNEDLLKKYRVIVLPYMAILTEEEKVMLMKAVRNGATLIVSGPKPGMWDADAKPRKKGLWADLRGDATEDRTTRSVGKGRVCFWKDHVGRKYLKRRDKEITTTLLSWLKDAGVGPWVNEKLPVVVQPYVYEYQTIIHVLNYSWVGKIDNQPKPLSLELSIPWDSSQKVNGIIQSEPQWDATRDLSFSQKENRLMIDIEVGINAIVIIDTK